MEDFKAILQGLRTGRVSSAVAKAVQCHPSVTITDPSQGPTALLILRNVASLLGYGMSLWSTRRHHEQQSNGHFGAPFCSFTMADSHVPRGTPASVRHPGNVCYDQHWETEEVLTSWKRPWEVSTKWLRNQTYPKLSMFSSSGASGHSCFPFLLCQMDVRKQRKLILNSLPAKPWSKPGESLLLCLIPAWFCLLCPCSCILLIIWH